MIYTRGIHKTKDSWNLQNVSLPGSQNLHLVYNMHKGSRPCSSNEAVFSTMHFKADVDFSACVHACMCVYTYQLYFSIYNRV